MSSKQVKPKGTGMVTRTTTDKKKTIPLVRTALSYNALMVENKKLNGELEVALACNKRMEIENKELTQRAEELSLANGNLEKALAREKIENKRLSEKTVSVQEESIQALEGWEKIREKKEYAKWTLILAPKKKKYELAKYLKENIEGETLRDVLIEVLKLLFSKRFFVKKISFGSEKKRVQFKNSNLLKSMQICLAEKFPAMDTSLKNIQKKIRNFKDALKKNDELWVELDTETTNSDSDSDDLE